MLILSRVCWALFIAAGRNIMMGGGGEGNSQKIQVWEYGRFPKTLTLLKRKKYVIFLT